MGRYLPRSEERDFIKDTFERGPLLGTVMVNGRERKGGKAKDENKDPESHKLLKSEKDTKRVK